MAVTITGKTISARNIDAKRIGVNLDLVRLGANLNQNTVTIPVAYSHPMLPDLSIERVAGIATITSHSIENFRRVIASPVVKYLNQTTGNDANNGDTPETAYKTLDKLRRQTFDRAFVTAGNYATDYTTVFGDNREYIKSGEGEVFFSRGFSDLIWTDAGGGVYTYSYHNTPINVIDTFTKDSDGNPVRLDLVGSVGELVENSYYYDAVGDLLSIKLTGNRPADSYVSFSINLHVITAGKQIHLDGIQLLGGLYLEENSVSRNTFTAINSAFLHLYSASAIRMNGNVNVWLENCTAAKARDDGFNYHANGSYNPAVVEVNCKGLNTGGSDNDGLDNSNNNGSTLHESAYGLRLNGTYERTEGPCVHDSGQATSLNIDVTSGESISVLSANKSSWAAASEVTDTVTMWLDGCTGGSVTTFGAENRATDNSTMYAKDSTITNIESGTVLESY